MTPLTIEYLVTAVISLAMLVVVSRWPRYGRFPFAALFAGAAIYNGITALRTPEAYVTGFAPHAFPPMREFIERVVSLAPDAIVLTIALGQLLVAVALAIGHGRVFILGVTGGAAFLAGITWLGVGAAFPRTSPILGPVSRTGQNHLGRLLAQVRAELRGAR